MFLHEAAGKQFKLATTFGNCRIEVQRVCWWGANLEFNWKLEKVDPLDVVFRTIMMMIVMMILMAWQAAHLCIYRWVSDIWGYALLASVGNQSQRWETRYDQDQQTLLIWSFRSKLSNLDLGFIFWNSASLQSWSRLLLTFTKSVNLVLSSNN